MAQLYNLEPQPTAKVILTTTAGDLSLELFAKQTPLASRNFLQHCLDGYYTNTIFHRLVPNFIIQGGDPTGTGHGGESVYDDGAAFKDEFHSRLKFNRRGLLGMANEGVDSNGAQFFLTLGETKELQGVNTMFGRLEAGDTIYNLMKMAEAEMTEEEGSERPLYPTKILSAEILVNPFEDMVKRVREAPRTKEESGRSEVKKRKKPAGKNVLSFVGGGEEEGEEAVMPVVKKVKVNPKMVSAAQEEETEAVASVAKEKKAPRRRKSPTPEPTSVETKAPPPTKPTPPQADSASPSPSPSPEPHTKVSKLDQTNAQIALIKASMKRSTTSSLPTQQEKPKNALEALIPATSTRGRKRGKPTDEKGALDLFKAFKARLEEMPASQNGDDSVAGVAEKAALDAADTTETAGDGEGDEEAELCDLHFIANCQSCKSWADQEEDGVEDAEDGGEDWMAHTLSFAKDTLGKDLKWKQQMAEIEIVDPREKARSIKEESRKGKGKEKGRRG